MNKSVYITRKESRTRAGVISEAVIDYDFPGRSDVLEVTLGSRNTDTFRINDIGRDEYTYTVKPQEFVEREVAEVEVTERVACGPPRDFARQVVQKYTGNSFSEERLVDESISGLLE